MSSGKAYILCRFAEKSQLYRPWLDGLPVPCEIVDDFPATWQVPEDAAIVISHMHYRWEDINAFRRIMDQGNVPILILADGILEYRNIYEHPDLADGCVFQPVIGHKLACLGRGQVRVIESWGNIGKCESVGLPRLDPVLNETPVPVRGDGQFRLLIATASTPAFGDRQREAVIESLRMIQQRFDQNLLINQRPVQVEWRLTDGLDRELGLPDTDVENRPGLSQAIDSSDAVIVTPSTVFLESLLKGRPTALLDFHNKPHFVPSAWMINAPKHLNSTLQELAFPPAPRMLFQQTVLHDQLECQSPATPRMIGLISGMVEEGRRARAEGRPFHFPHRMLDDPARGFQFVEPGFDLATLFPENHYFLEMDRARLVAELNLAVSRLEGIPEENSRLLQQMDLNQEHCDRLSERNNMLSARNLDLRERLMRIKKYLRKNDVQFGDDPDTE